MRISSILITLLAALLTRFAVATDTRRASTSTQQRTPARAQATTETPVYHHAANTDGEVQVTLDTAAGESTIYLPESLAKMLVARGCGRYA